MPQLEGEIYTRQNAIKELTIPETATIIGCGGTGFWTAVLLAMSGVKELILIDPDVLEASNLNRLPLTDSYVGTNKVFAAREFIEKIRNPIKIETHVLAIEKPEDCQLLRGHVFCCTDNLKSQQIICAYCKKNRLLYQRIGYDGTVLNVSKAFPLSFNKATEEGGYSITPSWVVPAVLAASAGVASKMFKEICLMDDISKLHMRDCTNIPKGVKDIFIEEGKDEILDNIHDHMPDGYGYCDDCESRFSEDDVQEIKNEARQEGFEEGKKEGYDEGYEAARKEFEKE